MAALQYVDTPGYHALLLRRTYADLALPEALMSRAHEWLRGSDAHWSAAEKTWTFPSGATLTFGYLASEGDKYRYQSSAFQFIGFDELTQFTEGQYTYLFSRLRRLEGMKNVPLRMRSASNPGGVGHDWVKQRFIVEGRTSNRVFIPSGLSDNPYLDKEEYQESLLNLDAVTRAQLLNGDWSARESGGMFRQEWFKIVPEVPAQSRRVRFWDLAGTEVKRGRDPDWTVGALVALYNGVYYLEDIRRIRGTPMTVEQLISHTASLDDSIPGHVSIRMEQEPGSSGINTIDHYARRVLLGRDFLGILSSGPKVERARPVSSAAEAGNFRIREATWIREFFDEADVFPHGSHDDQIDAVSGAVGALANTSKGIGLYF
jgi:predicted phage terminase large subunit-like protein